MELEESSSINQDRQLLVVGMFSIEMNHRLCWCHLFIIFQSHILQNRRIAHHNSSGRCSCREIRKVLFQLSGETSQRGSGMHVAQGHHQRIAQVKPK